jgi:hypothetical protein
MFQELDSTEQWVLDKVSALMFLQLQQEEQKSWRPEI